jgi:hypothetical protein
VRAASASSLQNVSLASQFGKRREITSKFALSNVQNQRTCSPHSCSRAQHRHAFLRLATTSDLKMDTKRRISNIHGEMKRIHRLFNVSFSPFLFARLGCLGNMALQVALYKEHGSLRDTSDIGGLPQHRARTAHA